MIRKIFAINVKACTLLSLDGERRGKEGEG
jgi:hypothetical protein